MAPEKSRRERPAKPALTRHGIVAAAVGILREEGLRKVTMRRLAQELDTGAASLYVYVRNTAELHAAILDELLGTITRSSSDGGWRDRLEQLLTAYAATLLEYPGLALSALVARPSGKNYLGLVETMLALLAEGDVPPERRAWGIDLLLQYATATAAEHADEESPEEWDALARAVHEADETTHPQIAAHAADLLSGQPAQRMSWGIRVLITGITGTAVPAERNPT
ncbi:TetR/AcrR family transcriptional regulator [Amycolatopsis regifaucium]|uniref:TetR family transcriptional regulator n=1 Tax=Amycolatopsis regifaucium TaxID=546365 RepID=A0A154MRG9_9PSEU|nr:TetR/AcrR family transcriptional regulator C-terminal domain-containing protein [Amycolatopsis regifaucium]KZB86533.1 TetR family transcriptional regulator [Amycolatopsis regifaucium]OKA03478.1 TetR family transcriptional regulator [Amycolatopsis regifaucium]SFJ14480.1 regulatory protein, tetR family [Amycolatopsis regifaucium]